MTDLVPIAILFIPLLIILAAFRINHTLEQIRDRLPPPPAPPAPQKG